MTTTISSLIEFLLAMLGDDELAEDFREDPEGVLSRYGLDSSCGADIRDARPMVADHVGVQATHHSPHYAHSHDAAPEITLITKNYVVRPGPETNEYNYYYIDDNDIIVTIDDRDTVTITADGDVTIVDSFNEDNDVTVIVDSFNEDNDGVDNKGGTIDDSVVAGDDISDSNNSEETTTVSGSANNTVTETNTDMSSDTTVDDSFNTTTSDNDVIDVDVSDIEVEVEVEADAGPAPTAVHEPDALPPVDDTDVVVPEEPGVSTTV